MNAVDFRRKQNINPIINKPMMATSRKQVSKSQPQPQEQNKIVTLDDVLYGDFSNKKNKNSVTLKFDNINDVLSNINSDDDDKKTKKKNNKILISFLKQEAKKINFSDY